MPLVDILIALQDLCPEIYSINADGTQSGSFCNAPVTTAGMYYVSQANCPMYFNAIFNSGCLAEVDSTWSVSWPATPSGANATQKCPGGSEAEGT